jgi:cytochrome o ubiquinol oxidase subunit 3
MSAAAAAHPRHGHDPYKVGRHKPDADKESIGHGQEGPASKRIVTAYGFWIFLLSDIIMFSAFFAAYGVLGHAVAGGPRASQLFEARRVAIETGLLLLSSYTCGLSAVASRAKSQLWTQGALLLTGLLGFAFLVLEVQEFIELIDKGAGPSRSAFLSSFYALVGCHGLHVGAGLLWLGTMMAQLWVKGFRDDVIRRLYCFNLFWHALDIIWVGVFTIVYLFGIRA